MADAASERLFELADLHDDGSQRLASDLGHLVAEAQDWCGCDDPALYTCRNCPRAYQEDRK
jgi:hypothetical protein